MSQGINLSDINAQKRILLLLNSGSLLKETTTAQGSQARGQDFRFYSDSLITLFVLNFARTKYCAILRTGTEVRSI